DPMLPGMRQRRGRCHAAARGPESLDLLLVFRKTAHRRAASHDPVGEANARADLIRRALDLDQQDSLAVGEPELGAPKLDRLDRTPIEKLRGGREDPRLEEIIERGHRVLEPRVPCEDDRACRRPGTRWPRSMISSRRG